MLEEVATHTSFVLEGPDGRRLETRVPLLGWYMAANAALAIVMLVEAGWDLDQITHVLERDGGIEGVVTRFAGSEFVLLETLGPWASSPEPPPWTIALVVAVDVLLLLVAMAAVGTSVIGTQRSWLDRSRGLPAGMLPRTQRGS